MKKLILLFLILSFTADLGAINVKIKDGWFYVNNEKYFIKGMGYEAGGRRGTLPWKRPFEPELLNSDFKRIKEAGFNTIRTWAPMTADEIKIAQKYGLNIIMGLYYDNQLIFKNDSYYNTAIALLQDQINTMKNFDNVIAYLVMNEPSPQVIQEAGLSKVYAILDRLIKKVREMDDQRPLSFATYAWLDYMDMSQWDFVAFNNYMYAPVTVKNGLGYRGYCEWLAKKYYPKPVIITEFGLSVSPDGEGKFGYGGNTLKEQEEGNIFMYDSLIQAGCSGGCAFMWTDGWWKSKDENTHDPHPEEWYGIIGIDKEDTPLEGIPRPVYYAYKKYNSAIWVSPAENIYSTDKLPIEIYCDNSKFEIQFFINDKRTELTRQGSWILGNILLNKKENTVKMIVKENNNTIKEESRKLVYREDYRIPNWENAVLKKDISEGDPIEIKNTSDKTNVRVTLFSPTSGAFHSYDHSSSSFKVDSRGYNGTISLSLSYPVLNHRAGIVEGINIEKISDTYLFQAVKKLKKYEFYGFEYENDLILKQEITTEYHGDSTVEKKVNFIDKTKGASSLEIAYSPKKQGSWYYSEMKFNREYDLSKIRYFSFMVKEDNSKNELKFMLVDKDGERYLRVPEEINKKGWQEHIFSVDQLGRDPYDNNRIGNNKLDLDRITGIVIVLTSPKSSNNSTLLIDEFSVYK